jgi:hypothetical protein
MEEEKLYRVCGELHELHERVGHQYRGQHRGR